MKCRSCGVELMIDHSEYGADGDTSPDTPTEIYTVLYLECRNPQCPARGQLLEGERIPLTTQ